MKDEYKQLRKKLKNEFTKPTKNNYAIYSSVGEWLKQCGIKPNKNHLNIICTIFGSAPYPHQEADRCNIIEYLQDHKYKDFKNETNKTV